MCAPERDCVKSMRIEGRVFGLPSEVVGLKMADPLSSYKLHQWLCYYTRAEEITHKKQLEFRVYKRDHLCMLQLVSKGENFQMREEKRKEQQEPLMRLLITSDV